MSLTLNGVPDPVKLASTIIASAKLKTKEQGTPFSTWQVETRKYKEGTIECLVHIGEGGWETAGAFGINPDVNDKELRFYCFGYDKRYGYIHGRLLEQLAVHYATFFETITYKDERKAK